MGRDSAGPSDQPRKRIKRLCLGKREGANDGIAGHGHEIEKRTPGSAGSSGSGIGREGGALIDRGIANFLSAGSAS